MGTYGAERQLVYTIKADENYLKNGPLGPIQRSRLAKKIASNRERLARIRKERREEKSRTSLDNKGEVE